LSVNHHALSPTDKLLIGLRFYASGAVYNLIGDATGPDKSSVCRSIQQVTKAINIELFDRIVAPPPDMSYDFLLINNLMQTNLDSVRTNFYSMAGFPCAWGCIDGTLVRILRPNKYEEQYVDRNGDHSLNCMFVCGPNRKFYWSKTGAPGHQHDARVFRESILATRLESGWRPFQGAVLLGDSGYALRDYLLVPLANPITEREQRYNFAHKKTRCVIECAYGNFKVFYNKQNTIN
jgi:nuclease HARBI1